MSTREGWEGFLGFPTGFGAFSGSEFGNEVAILGCQGRGPHPCGEASGWPLMELHWLASE